jgi:soluble lytic murein transglycosylase
MGKSDWAKRWYRAAADQSTTFYGQLASSRLGLPVSVELPQPKPPSAAERHKFDNWELVRIAHLLGDLDQVELQQTFLYHLRDLAKTESDYELAASLAIERRRPDIALSIAKRARNDGIWLSEQLFPMPTLHATSQPEHALVLAVVRQESAFDEGAISYAGARGLMQLMPATAKHVARTIGVRYSRDRLTKDANYNLRIGRAYLSRLLDSFDGSEMLALAAYNAGPQRVSQWIKENGDPRSSKVDPVEWIERIPFSETRNYVMRVLESLVVYRHRMNSQLVELPLSPR